MSQRILIVEDDAKTAASLALYLKDAGYAVETVRDGRKGLDAALSGGFDLIVLDLMLPGLDGRAVCRRVREVSSIPILMLTARTTEDDRVDGLDLGADDYITKPFSPREVTARIRAVLRRLSPPGDEVLRFDGLTVDIAGRRVITDAGEASLTPTEFDLLVCLARAPGRVFSRDALLERAFGDDFDGFDRTVDAHVMNLRKKIEPDRSAPRFVVTVFGAGYRFAGRPADG